MSLKRSLSLFSAALVTASLLIPMLPNPSTAQILPPFRFGGRPIRPLPVRVDRGYKAAFSARYYFQVPNPRITITRLTITEVTNNFTQKGGRFDLRKLEIRACSSLGNVLRRPTCEGTIPIKQATICSSAFGCQSYDAVEDKLTENPDPFDDLAYIQVDPVQPIAPGGNFMLVFSDVTNPRSPVDYQFNLAATTVPGRVNQCEVVTVLGDCALGTWLVSIRSDASD
jgi:hypothetical protein